MTSPLLRTAVIGDDTTFAVPTARMLAKLPGLDVRIGPVEELLAWEPELVVVDVRAGARLLVPALHERDVDVLVAAARPVVAVIEGALVYDKERPQSLVPLVEGVRRRRVPDVDLTEPPRPATRLVRA